MIAQQGEPLTTYTVVASNGNQYCYCIECNIIGEPGRGFDLDQTIRQRNDFRRDVLCRQRELIRKDFENSGRLYQDCCRKWSNHASIEIISADGFLHPNILFSMTQPRLMIRYRLIKTSSKGKDVVVLKGHTDRVMKTPAIGSTIEFAVHFTATFVVIIFVSTQTYCSMYSSVSQTSKPDISLFSGLDVYVRRVRQFTLASCCILNCTIGPHIQQHSIQQCFVSL